MDSWRHMQLQQRDKFVAMAADRMELDGEARLDRLTVDYINEVGWGKNSSTVQGKCGMTVYYVSSACSKTGKDG
jgi:hypothetical protein